MEIMKQLTIRGVDDRLHQELRTRAAQHGTSVNRYVLGVLKGSVGLGNGGVLRDVEFDDLDHLAGTWTQQEYEEFNGQLESQRSIDTELWQ